LKFDFTFELDEGARALLVVLGVEGGDHQERKQFLGFDFALVVCESDGGFERIFIGSLIKLSLELKLRL